MRVGYVRPRDLPRDDTFPDFSAHSLADRHIMEMSQLLLEAWAGNNLVIYILMTSSISYRGQVRRQDF